MTDLSLTFTINAPRALSGQSVGVRVEFKNVSAQTLQLLQPYGVQAPPLVFALRTSPDDAEKPVYELSRAQLDAALLGHDTPMGLPPEFVDLAPGDKTETEDDLGELTLAPIAVGHYFVRAEWRQPGLPAVSNFDALEILAPVVVAYSPLLCAESHEAVGLLAHQGDTGTIVFERRVTTPEPQVGRLTTRHFLPTPSVVRDVAIAAHTANDVRGRWHAWLRDNELWAAQSWGDALMAKPAPLRADVAEPRFAHPMFHLTSGRGIVVVWGQTPGRPVLQRFDLEPKRLRAGPAIRIGGVAPTRVLTRALSERGRLAVFWSEHEVESTCIRGCVLDEKGRLTSDPVVHFTSTLPTLAWDVAPLGNLAETELHLVLGPDARGAVSYVVAPLAGVSAPPMPDGFVRTLPRFIPSNALVLDSNAPDPSDPTPPQWLDVEAAAVSGVRHKDPVLVIRCGSTLLLARASRPGWDVIYRIPPVGLERLHVLAHATQRWAGFCEPRTGLVYLPI